MKINAKLEQAGDGSWTASFLEPGTIVLGTGDTRDAALADLRSGLETLLEAGERLPEAATEYVTLELTGAR